jgi:hypothetical protein
MTKKEQKQKIKEMNLFYEMFDHLEDGAFFCLAEDMHGWTQDDWVWLYQNE